MPQSNPLPPDVQAHIDKAVADARSAHRKSKAVLRMAILAGSLILALILGLLCYSAITQHHTLDAIRAEQVQNKPGLVQTRAAAVSAATTLKLLQGAIEGEGPALKAEFQELTSIVVQTGLCIRDPTVQHTYPALLRCITSMQELHNGTH